MVVIRHLANFGYQILVILDNPICVKTLLSDGGRETVDQPVVQDWD